MFNDINLSNREMAVGNTFGATALTSYGGFWIAMAITFTPGGFEISQELAKADNGSMGMFYDSLGLFLMVQEFAIHSPANFDKTNSFVL
jgi:succinate-acetate transporter protein